MAKSAYEYGTYHDGPHRQHRAEGDPEQRHVQVDLPPLGGVEDHQGGGGEESEDRRDQQRRAYAVAEGG